MPRYKLKRDFWDNHRKYEAGEIVFLPATTLVVDPDTEEVKTVPLVPPRGAIKWDDSDIPPPPEADIYTDMSIDNLRKEVEARKLEVGKGAKRDDLIAALRESDHTKNTLSSQTPKGKIEL
jgi:hypothetical protein